MPDPLSPEPSAAGASQKRKWFSRSQSTTDKAEEGGQSTAVSETAVGDPVVTRPPEHLARVVVPVHVLDLTLTGLALGRHREMLAYWLGTPLSASADPARPAAIVTTVAFPRIVSTDSYFKVEDGQLTQLTTWCAARGLWVLAQVHSHPTDEPHSEADERWPASHRPGFLSVVVPFFAQLSSVREPHWRLYEHQGDGEWEELRPADRLHVLPDVWLPSSP